MSQGVTYPFGFQASGIYCGIKKKKRDLALLVSEKEAATAALFTTNVIKSDSLRFCKKQLEKSKYSRALVVISGIANCCVGKKGLEDAKTIVRHLARELSVPYQSCLIGTTGIIGTSLPVSRVLDHLPTLKKKLSRDGGQFFAEGITTTDTRTKQAQSKVKLKGGTVRIGGCAKGSGMIAPHMATMFAFFTTDAKISPDTLHALLKKACERSFHAITVDGDQSPADMVIAFANGASGVRLSSEDLRHFEKALKATAEDLALQIVKDGEGANKLVRITVRKAISEKKAKTIAMAVARSLLVKTALFGEDPNWGRVLTAAGASGASFDPRKLKLSINGKLLYCRGGPTSYGIKPPSSLLKPETVDIELDLGEKRHKSFTVYTCDLSYRYVQINAEYHT